MDEKKITNKERYQALINYINSHTEAAEAFDGYEMIPFLEQQITTLEHKTEKAKERAAKKAAAGDELRERIYNMLDTTKPTLVNELVSAIDEPEITRNVVINRLTSLVKTERVTKEDMFVEVDGKKKKFAGYLKVAE